MKRKSFYILGGIIALIVFIIVIAPKSEQKVIQKTEQNNVTLETTGTDSASQILNETETGTPPPSSQHYYYSIVSVVDGDTVKININGKVETFRLIGMDTPETVDPRKPVQCFGTEASNKAKELLSGKKVRIETDDSQGTYDKYNRMLGYIFLENNLFYNKHMIEQGYAHEYTYNTPYKYQTEFKNAQKEAQDNERGLWSSNTCGGNTTNPDTSVQTDVPGSCSIKGNIGSTGEKIYHIIGCGSYIKTVIDESKGEKYFCSEQEALSAGWRKALNCN